MAEKSNRSFWSDFVAGLAGPAGAGSRPRRRPLHGSALRRAEEEALDAFDTLINLRDTDFWFDEDYEPVIRQLKIFHKMGYVSTPPELLRDGANIGHGVILTPAGLDFIKMGRESVETKIAENR